MWYQYRQHSHCSNKSAQQSTALKTYVQYTITKACCSLSFERQQAALKLVQCSCEVLHASGIAEPHTFRVAKALPCDQRNLVSSQQVQAQRCSSVNLLTVVNTAQIVTQLATLPHSYRSTVVWR
eukprot:20820-Heterococcus_DN1.PRE.1